MDFYVTISLSFKKDYKGLFVETPIEFDQKLIVLTGKNGSGKTRLLESIQNFSAEVIIDGSPVTREEVKYIQQQNFNPSLGGRFSEADNIKILEGTLQTFEQNKDIFDQPFDSSKRIRGRGVDSSLDYRALHSLTNTIASKLNKSPSELTHNEISFHFSNPTANFLGIKNLSEVCNRYLKRLNENEINEWKKTVKRIDVDFYDGQQFETMFGKKPWLIINEIIDDIFDGKFSITEPDEATTTYNYTAQFLENGKPLDLKDLSSGEKTLLWLALTLFNTQYCKDDIVSAPKVLLLDEPDAYLHPKMVLKMYKALSSFHKNFGALIILSTHSPTTVALAPDNSIYLVYRNELTAIEKDYAISELLDGVSQIALDPKNRRQVFVESLYDAGVYLSIYSKLSTCSDLLDKHITLNFISSGPKMPMQQIIDKVNQILKISDREIIEEFAQSLNGIGDCGQVIGQVETLADNESVRGIIDWDGTNKSNEKISVFAEGLAYAIENIALDPICILLLLHVDRTKDFTMEDICGKDISYAQWLNEPDLLQEAMDRYLEKVLKRPSNRDIDIQYISGITLHSDDEYLKMRGHDLELRVLDTFPQLNAYRRSRKEGELKSTIVNKAMLLLTDGRFIPQLFADVIGRVQK